MSGRQERTPLAMTAPTGPSEKRPPGDTIMVHADPVLETHALNIYYGDNRIIHHISITVPKNKITALIGPSGSGKTTLPVEVRRRIGMVFQKPNPFPK
jgi:ABC-type phosphate transport system ATPase subunit